jgi:hypothetical protein
MFNSLLARFRRSLFLVMTVGLCAGSSLAGESNPGSLLVLPEYDARPGVLSFLTVTNVHPDSAIGIHYRFVGADDIHGHGYGHVIHRRLEPSDTLTILASVVVPDESRGYCFVYATSLTSERAVDFDYLVGSIAIFEGTGTSEYILNAISFQGLAGEGANTNVNGDSMRDLDGIEYSPAPAELIIPQFFGQGLGAGMPQTELILISLVSSQNLSSFVTTVDFLICNDNGNVYSAEHTFFGWTRVQLANISGVVTNDFLKNNTNHNPGEIRGFPTLEAGWIRMRGAVASSTSTNIANPAILAAVVDTGHMTAASLPFSMGENFTGSLGHSGFIR